MLFFSRSLVHFSINIQINTLIFPTEMSQDEEVKDVVERVVEVNVSCEEDQLVAEATSSMRGLHIENPYTSDKPHTDHHGSGNVGLNCTCDRNLSSSGAAKVPNICEYCRSAGRVGSTLMESRDGSGTEDSSLSSDTPSDSSDSSESSDTSTDSSDTELENQTQSDVNKMGNVQLRE